MKTVYMSGRVCKEWVRQSENVTVVLYSTVRIIIVVECSSTAKTTECP